MRKLAWMFLCMAPLAASLSAAEPDEEFLVTSARTDKTVVPGAILKRPADYLLQRIKVSSDAPEASVRSDEIFATLRLMQAAASRDRSLELSLLLDYGVIVPLRIEPAAVKLRPGGRAQTSEVVVAVKTRVAAGTANPTALYARLREFPVGIKPAGRAAVDLMGEIELTIVNPAQYRESVIRLYAADAKAVTSSLGPEYRVITKGIDRQLQWLRDGPGNIVFYIPYEYDVIPVNVNAYPRIGN